MAEYRFFLTLNFTYMDPVLIRENDGRRKPVFWHSLRGVTWSIAKLIIIKPVFWDILRIVMGTYLLLGAFVWFHRKMSFFHCRFNHTNWIRPLSFRVNTLLAYDSCNIAEHLLKMLWALFLWNLKLTFV